MNGDPRLKGLGLYNKEKFDLYQEEFNRQEPESILDSNMNKETNQQLPHRFRETSFRLYEPILNDIVCQWPNVVKCIPSHFNRAQSTFACRLRDAKLSLFVHKWSTIIDRASFEGIYSRIEVSERTDGSVLCGPKESIQAHVRLSSNGIPLSNPIPEEGDQSLIIDVSESARKVLGELSQARRISPRLLLKVSKDDVQWMEQNFDIALNKNQDGTYTLI